MAKKHLRSPPVASTSLRAGRGGKSSSANRTEEGSSSSSSSGISAEEAFHDEYHPFSSSSISSSLLSSEKDARHAGQRGGKASKGARRKPSKSPRAEKTPKEKDSNPSIRSTGGKTAAPPPPPLSSSSSLLPSPASSMERSTDAARRRRATSKAVVVPRSSSPALKSRASKEVTGGGGELATALSSPSSITEVSTRTRTHARNDSLVLEGVGEGKSVSKERSQKRHMKVTAVKEHKGVKKDRDTTTTFVEQKTTAFATHTKEQATDVKSSGHNVGRRVRSTSRAVSTVTTSSSSVVTAPLVTPDWPSLPTPSLRSLDESSQTNDRPKSGDTPSTPTPSSSSVRTSPRSRRVKGGTPKKRGRIPRRSRSLVQTSAKKTSGGPKRTPAVKKKHRREKSPKKNVKKGGGGEGKVEGKKEEEEVSLPSALPSSNPSHDTATVPPETPATLPRPHALPRSRSGKRTHQKRAKHETKRNVTTKKKKQRRFLVGKQQWKTRGKPATLPSREKPAPKQNKTPSRRGSREEAKRLSKKAPPHPPFHTPFPSSSSPLSASHWAEALPSLTSTIATASAAPAAFPHRTTAAAAVPTNAAPTAAPPPVRKDRRKRSPLAVALLPDAPLEAPLLYPPSDQPPLPASTRRSGIGGEKIFEEEVGEEEEDEKRGSRGEGVAPSPFFPSSAFCGPQMENVFLFIICACKAAYAVPSIYFNATSGRVEPNPYYGRHTAAKRIALQGVVPHLLFPVSSPAVLDQLTPREALLCLEKALLLLFTSLFASFPALDGGGEGGNGSSFSSSSSSSSSTWSSVFSSAAAAIHGKTNDADLHTAVLVVLEAQERLHTPVVCHKEVRSALPFVSRLQHCLAHRTASPFQIAILGHLLHGGVGGGGGAAASSSSPTGGGLTSLTLMEYLTALRQRIQMERSPMEFRATHRRSPAESFSLDVSTKSVEDLVAALEAVQVGYTAVQVPTTTPSAISSSSSSSLVSSCVASAALLCQGFYRLLRVVLQLSSLDGFLWRYATGAAVLPLPTPDGKRTGRHGGEGGGEVGAGFELPPQLASRVTQFDPSTGRLTLSRASCHIPWGLELNRAGELVSLHHHTRHATAEGGECFQALQHDSSFPCVGNTSFVPRGWYVVKVEEEKIPLVRPPPSSSSSLQATEDTDTTREEKERAGWERQEQVEQWEYRTTYRYRKLLKALQKASTPAEARIAEADHDDGREGKKRKTPSKKKKTKDTAFQGKTLHLQLALFPSVFSLGATTVPPRGGEKGGDRVGVSEIGCIPLSHALGSGSSSRPTGNGNTRVLLLLERPSTTVPWGLSLEFPPVPPSSSSSFTPSPLDAEAARVPSNTTPPPPPLSSAERARKRRLALREVEEKSFCGPAFSPRLLRITSSSSTLSDRHHPKKKKKKTPTKSSKGAKPSFSLQLSPTTQAFVDRFAGELWVRGVNGMPTVDIRSGLPHVLYSSTPLPGRSTSRPPTPLMSGPMQGGGGGSGSGEAVSASQTSSIFGSRRPAVPLSGEAGPWRNRAALSQFLSSSLVLALELERVRPTVPESKDDGKGGPPNRSSSGSPPPPTSGGSGGVLGTTVTPPGWALADTPTPLRSEASLALPRPVTPAAAAVETQSGATDTAAVVVPTEAAWWERRVEEEGTTPATAVPPRPPRGKDPSRRLHRQEEKKTEKTSIVDDSGMETAEDTPEAVPTPVPAIQATLPSVPPAVDLSASLPAMTEEEKVSATPPHEVVDRTAMGEEERETPTVVLVPSAKGKVLRAAVAAAAAVAHTTPLPASSSSPEEKAKEEALHTEPMEPKRRAGPDRPLTSPSAPQKVRLVDLMDAPALNFGNRVVMESYDGTVAAFQRPSLQVPWEMNMAIKGAEIWLTRLPPFPASLVQPSSGKGDASRVKHPFGVYLGASPDGTVRAKVEEINGKDVALMSKLQRQNALQSIRGEKTLRLVLQSMRK